MGNLVLIFLLVSTFCFGQAAVVVDVGANAQLTGIQSQMSLLNSMEATKTNLEVASKSAQFVSNIKTAYQLLKLLESTICTYKDLNILKESTKSNRFCHFQFAYNVYMVDLSLAMDLINTAISGATIMSQGERSQSFTSALDKFKRGNQGLADIQSALNSQNFEMLYSSKVLRDVRKMNSLSRY